MWTMLCRGVLAGVVFSAAAPGMVFAIVSVVVRTFSEGPNTERVAVEVWLRLMAGVLPMAAAVAWRRFLRLEALEARAGDASLPRPAWLRRDAVPGHPLWQLIKKELWLQQMAFALTALFVAGSVATALWEAWVNGYHELPAPMRVASAIYWLALPALLAALATAEERQLRTLSWQLQLPTPAWQQWAVKAATVFALALVLAVGVPSLLTEWLWPGEHRSLALAVLLAVITTAVSLYVSSLCATGVRAALASLATVPLALWLVATAAAAIRQARFAPAFWSGREASWLVLTLLLIVALLGFAFLNHRSELPDGRLVRRQALSLAALTTLGLLTIESVSAWSRVVP
jgi:hypothetical protein